MTEAKRLEEMGVLELLEEYNKHLPAKKHLHVWKSSRRRLVLRIEELRSQIKTVAVIISPTLSTPDWPYRLFTEAEYNKALIQAGVGPKDITRIACEKLLSVVVGTREVDIEVRGDGRKYLRTDTVDCAYGIPYELILDYLKETFPDKATSYHCLRWYMVRMRENSGQPTSQKKASVEKLAALKVQGSAALPDRRERLMRSFQKKVK